MAQPGHHAGVTVASAAAAAARAATTAAEQNAAESIGVLDWTVQDVSVYLKEHGIEPGIILKLAEVNKHARNVSCAPLGSEVRLTYMVTF